MGAKRSEKLENFLASIENACGTQMFRSFYKDGADVLQDGKLSCGYFATTVLLMHGLIDRVHFRVDGTEAAMRNHGWYTIPKPRIGCVVVWNPIAEDGGTHYHIGFYVGRGRAVSNRSPIGVPGMHALRYSGRADNAMAVVKCYYWHDNLSATLQA